MWTTDDLDIPVKRAIASPHSFPWDVHSSDARVAAGLHIDEETARKWLRRMNDARFLRGWHFVVNLVLLGREAAVAELRFGDSKSTSKYFPR
jgi:hypothetical protein